MLRPFDITLQREAIYRDFQGQPGPCPRCGGKLTQRHEMYLVDTRTGKHTDDSFMMGSNFGWFCETCPTVVLNTSEVGKMLSFHKPGWKVGSEFAVVGLINLDAVPKNKRDRLLGDDDNPIPLVPFKDIQGEAAELAPSAPSLWPARRPRPVEAAKPKASRRKKKK